MAAKEVKFSRDARERILNGVDILGIIDDTGAVRKAA